jgi:hypothetical protein
LERGWPSDRLTLTDQNYYLFLSSGDVRLWPLAAPHFPIFSVIRTSAIAKSRRSGIGSKNLLCERQLYPRKRTSVYHCRKGPLMTQGGRSEVLPDSLSRMTARFLCCLKTPGGRSQWTTRRVAQFIVRTQNQYRYIRIDI